MVKHELDMSHEQLKKLAAQKAIILKLRQLYGGKIVLDLPEAHSKRIVRAIKKGKGIKLKLNEDEIEGAGVRDWLKKGWRFYKKYVKPVVAPHIKAGLNALVDTAVTAGEAALVGEVPELAPIAVPAAEYLKKKGKEGVEYVGKKTAAWGVRSRKSAYGIHNKRVLMGH